MATVELGKQTITLEGEFPAEGDRIEDFDLLSSRMKSVSLDRYRGQPMLLATVPSIDTFVCANNARRLDDLASQTPEVSFVLVSEDLPFAQARFAKAENLKHLQLLSTMRNSQFAIDYGVKMQNGPLQGLLARALWMVDPDGRVIHAELVADVGQEPDYAAAMSALV